ncbi:MAG: hypothetical protein U0230_03130 [Polyangiales bacterium]
MDGVRASGAAGTRHIAHGAARRTAGERSGDTGPPERHDRLDPPPGSLRVESLPAAERALFLRVTALVDGLESGGTFVASRRRTTAGAPASIGRSQLLVSLQVRALVSLPDPSLARLGVARAELEALERKGSAALAYYDFLVRGRGEGPSGLDRASLDDLRRTASERDFAGLVARHGRAFEAATGLPARELELLARTRDLVRAVRAVGRGLPPTAACRRFDLEPLRARLGDHLGFYLRRGHVAENRAGWYTRAAMSEPPSFERFVAALERGGDRLASEQRALRDHRAAAAVVDGLRGAEGLDARARLSLLAQLVRVRHASPSAFERLFLGDGTRPTDLASLHGLLDALAAQPDGPTGRAQLGRTVRVARRAVEREATRHTEARLRG